MVCLLRVHPAKVLLVNAEHAAAELMSLLLPLNQKQLNAVPFAGSWTAAQLAVHVTKSNRAIAQAMEMDGQQVDRDPAARAAELKTVFLDFSVKFDSPAFIVPENHAYSKEAVVYGLQSSNLLLQQYAATANTNEMINLPALGEITKLELLHFVCYHTQRHIHQLQNILRYVQATL